MTDDSSSIIMCAYFSLTGAYFKLRVVHNRRIYCIIHAFFNIYIYHKIKKEFDEQANDYFCCFFSLVSTLKTHFGSMFSEKLLKTEYIYYVEYTNKLKKIKCQ